MVIELVGLRGTKGMIKLFAFFNILGDCGCKYGNDIERRASGPPPQWPTAIRRGQSFRHGLFAYFSEWSIGSFNRQPQAYAGKPKYKRVKKPSNH